MEKWQTKRILILGTTYPSHSNTYVETVCTGGIFEDSLEMVRLYPIPHRYLDEDKRFHAFQFIKANVTYDPQDPRPESYRIDFNTIELQEQIPPDKHEVRRSYLERSPHFCQSVEDLIERQQANKTSLGIIIPDSITDCSIEKRPESERRNWEVKEEARQQQERLFGSKPKALDFPEANFFVHWTCRDDRCKGHKMSLHQWGIHELYRKYKDKPDGNQKVIEAMQKKLNQWEKDVFMFLGNFRGRMFNFGLMDTYSAKAKVQSSLFS
jgi:hypothetical protein